jgi:hypothetical protein
VAKRSSQHDKCQVGNMLWTEDISQPERCQVGNVHSKGWDLVPLGTQSFGGSSTITRAKGADCFSIKGIVLS